MDTKALRQKILDLAIHGKLVPQDPSDEPASVLLERIRSEKQRMIESGEIKKDKNESYIYVGDDKRHYEKFADGSLKDIEDEIPFELPEGWEWCRLGNIANVKGGKRIPKGCSFSSTTIKHAYLRVTDMKNNTIVSDDIKYIDDDVYEQIKNYSISLNDLYLTIAGTIGAVGTIPSKYDKANLTENAVKLTHIMIHKMFLCKIIQSDVIQNQFIDKIHQVAQPKLAIERILMTFIPLPPLSEQTRIVQAIESAFTQIDIIEKNKADIQELIKQAKSKVLDLAIHGELVPQDPNDEPASVLLERIKAEKEELIKQGKIKRDKKSAEVFTGGDNLHYQRVGDDVSCIEEDLPYEIPDSWGWSNLESICSLLTDGTHKTPDYSDKGYIFLSSKNVTSGKIDWTNVMYIPEKLHTELYSRLAPQVNDILLAKNGTTGVAAIVDKDCVFDIYVSLALLRVFNEYVHAKYVLHIMESEFIQTKFKGELKGIGVPNLHLENIRRTLIPMPPLVEQQRIITAIEDCFMVIDKISCNL